MIANVNVSTVIHFPCLLSVYALMFFYTIDLCGSLCRAQPAMLLGCLDFIYVYTLAMYLGGFSFSTSQQCWLRAYWESDGILSQHWVGDQPATDSAFVSITLSQNQIHCKWGQPMLLDINTLKLFCSNCLFNYFSIFTKLENKNTSYRQIII